MKTKSLVMTALFAALICIGAPFSIQIGIIPITLSTLLINFTAALLGSKKGVIAVSIYILMGAIGLPVFSRFAGGAQVLIGPTGGYIWGYLLIALIVGVGCERFSFKGHITLFMALGAVVCNLCGTVWYMIVSKVTFIAAFDVCFLPFIFTDALKVFICAVLVSLVKKPLSRFL